LLSSVQKELVKDLPDSVKIMNPQSLFVPRKEYDKMINDLDYIYCPYPETAFKYTASGALLEAISKRKPIIMHNNNYGNYLRKKYGKFGVIVSTTNFYSIKEELKDMMKYTSLVKMQDSVLERLSPEAQSSKLEYICDNI
jgi:hypothetical protein